MIEDLEVAKLVAKHLQDSYRLLDDSAAEVRERCSAAEIDDYIQRVGKVCAEIIFELMEPLYLQHPQLAPKGWDLPLDQIATGEDAK